jgi:hypothetical protein
LFPAADLFDDGTGVGGPDEGLGGIVGLPQEAVNGGLEIGDAFVADEAFSRVDGRLTSIR